MNMIDANGNVCNFKTNDRVTVVIGEPEHDRDDKAIWNKFKGKVISVHEVPNKGFSVYVKIDDEFKVGTSDNTMFFKSTELV